MTLAKYRNSRLSHSDSIDNEKYTMNATSYSVGRKYDSQQKRTWPENALFSLRLLTKT